MIASRMKLQVTSNKKNLCVLCYCTLLVHKFNFLHFLLRVPAVIVSFFCTVLQLFALVLCFGDQVLSPGSSLATDFFGVVPLWRVAQEKFFQP